MDFKYYIVHMVKHTAEQWSQSPAEEAATQKEINDFILSYKGIVEQVQAFHCMGMGSQWDWIGIFGTNELSDWVGFREDLIRSQKHHIEKFESFPAIPHDRFIDGTRNSKHYQQLREMGVLPGMAERVHE